MVNLIYSVFMSLDGYMEDASGNFDWAAPDEQVHQFVNDLERSVGTYLLGRRMYETMKFWESEANLAGEPPAMLDFAKIWQAANKIVFSRTLETASTRRTRVEKNFDPGAIRQLKEEADKDISIGGPELAAHAFQSGLIDECHLFILPILVGGGKKALPDQIWLELDLMDERHFDNGTVFLRYRVKQAR